MVEYRELQEFPGYRFGSDGSVWTRRSLTNSRNKFAPDWRKLKQSLSHGYCYVSPCNRLGIVKRMRVHRLIYQAFFGEIRPGLHIAHINGNRQDNSIVNLSAVSQKENEFHKKAHGTACVGEKQHAAKLTTSDVEKIRNLRAAGQSPVKIGSKFNINRSYVWAIVKKKAWSHV